jgi:hypothetical protein
LLTRRESGAIERLFTCVAALARGGRSRVRAQPAAVFEGLRDGIPLKTLEVSDTS